MIPREFDYHSPKILSDALGLLAKFGDEAKLLAGGQDRKSTRLNSSHG